MVPAIASELFREALPAGMVILVVFVAAAWAGGSSGQKTTGLLFAGLATLPPWWLPSEDRVLRALTALVAVIGVMRVIDLRRGSWSLRARLVHVASPVDTRHLAPTSKRLEWRRVGIGLAWASVAALAYTCLAVLPRPSGQAPAIQWLGRWGVALVVVYAGVSAGYSLIEVAYAAGGFATRPLHVTPATSASVQQFWAERWARPISAWINDTIMRPLARRRRPVLGLALGFAASGWFHAYAVWVALGPTRGVVMAGLMFGYFAVQGVLVGVERALGVRRWSTAAKHAWTVLVILGTSPLFLEPAIQVLGH